MKIDFQLEKEWCLLRKIEARLRNGYLLINCNYSTDMNISQTSYIFRSTFNYAVDKMTTFNTPSMLWRFIIYMNIEHEIDELN